MTPIERNLIRAARALLGWSREELSRASGRPPTTVVRVEQLNRQSRRRSRAAGDIIAALERGGVEFAWGDSGPAGISLSAGARVNAALRRDFPKKKEERLSANIVA